MDKTHADYSSFDRSEILEVLFHPRQDPYFSSEEENTYEVFFDMPDDARINAKLHAAGKESPVVLFFHGNGEIVSDYDDLGPVFTGMNISFFVFDYRGYGKSTGKPTVTAMMNDSILLFDMAMSYLDKKGFKGPVVVMGRSLGSAPALEVAVNRSDRISGLVIESGFAFMLPLLELLGLYKLVPGITEDKGPANYKKIRNFTKPTLIIHAQYDHIIPFTDGAELYENSGAPDKTLLEIKGADHNNIFMVGFRDYMDAMNTLCEKLVS